MNDVVTIAADGVDLPDARFDAIRTGGKQALATALSSIEIDPFSSDACALLDNIREEASGHVLGVTGPPGAGKSTLIDVLVRRFRGDGKTVAVLAVDPSSQLTGGALLGDRIRMRTNPHDTGVFVRSVAARNRLGGLARTVFPCVVLLRALYQIVIVESVGVGQSETDVTNVADTVILCIQPGSGDSLQFMKAGILEIPDIAVVTKADAGALATRALADMKGALGLVTSTSPTASPICLSLSAVAGSGVDDLILAIAQRQLISDAVVKTKSRREIQSQAWIEAEIASAFGQKGVELAGRFLRTPDARKAPFQTGAELLSRLHVGLDG